MSVKLSRILTSVASMLAINPVAISADLVPTKNQKVYAYPIGSVGRGPCLSTGISDEGHVAGYTYVNDQQRRYYGFVTGPRGLGLTKLLFKGASSYAGGINAQGQVTGASDVNFIGTNPVAFVTDPGGANMRALDIPGYSPVGKGINVTGQVTGSFLDNNSVFRGFIAGADGEIQTLLGTLGGPQTYPTAINASGQVIGQSDPAGETGLNHGFITGANGTGMTDLGLFGGTGNYPIAINDQGMVTGIIGFKNNTRRQQYVTGPNGVGLRKVGSVTYGSGGAGINNDGTAVGISLTAAGKAALFIFDIEGHQRNVDKMVVNLPKNVHFSEVGGINNFNQIAATGTDQLCYIVCPTKNCVK